MPSYHRVASVWCRIQTRTTTFTTAWQYPPTFYLCKAGKHPQPWVSTFNFQPSPNSFESSFIHDLFKDTRVDLSMEFLSVRGFALNRLEKFTADLHFARSFFIFFLFIHEPVWITVPLVNNYLGRTCFFPDIVNSCRIGFHS